MISRQPFSAQSLFLFVGTALVIFPSSSAAAAETKTANSNTIRAAKVNVNANLNRFLQENPYDYTSPNVKARAASISKDWQEIGGLFALQTNDGKQQAKALYELGAYCQSYATLKLSTPVQGAMSQGTPVNGKTKTGSEVQGLLHIDANQGDDTIQFMYLIPDDKGITSICSVAGNFDPQTDECLQLNGDIVVPGGATLSYTEYDLVNDTANGMSLQKMSSTIAGAKTQGYPGIGAFTDYYGTNKYADEFIQAAFDKADTSFINGNAEFSKFQQHGTDRFISLATLTMNSWMHVIIKMMDAVELCKIRDDGEKQVSEVPNWDNAVATYRGMGGAAGGAQGQLYHLANEYCQKFGTCLDGVGNTEGISKVNEQVYIHFNSGKQDLLDGNCANAESAAEQAAAVMIIPLIQGLLFHAYELDQFNEDREIVQGEAAAFLHSVLPLVSSCSEGNGVLVYDQIKVGNGAEADFGVIKSLLEGLYSCLKISCEDIGGIVDLADKTTYQVDAFPCEAIPNIPADPSPIAPSPIDPSPIAPPAPQPTQHPTIDPGDGFPTSTPTDPPSRLSEKIDYDATNGDDGVTDGLAIGLPLLSLVAIGFVVGCHYRKKKITGKEFHANAENMQDPSPDDEKVENLQAEIL